jgi:hypothetical protein
VVLRQQRIGGRDRHRRDPHVQGRELQQAVVDAVVGEQRHRTVGAEAALQQGAGDPLDEVEGGTVRDAAPAAPLFGTLALGEEGALRRGASPVAQELAETARKRPQLVPRAQHQAAAGERPGLEGDRGEPERPDRSVSHGRRVYGSRRAARRRDGARCRAPGGEPGIVAGEEDAYNSVLFSAPQLVGAVCRRG